MVSKTANRENYFARINGLVEKYPKILIVHADHVGSRQMAEIRSDLRGRAVILMGKNTKIRTALKGKSEEMPKIKNLIEYIKLNIGLVFCIEDPAVVRASILENKVPAAARQGLIAPIDVSVPSGPTGLDPSQTNFFQALGISTKIVKGQIEIQTEKQLIVKGQKVEASQSTLLQKLNIKPFAYGLEPTIVYDDGQIYKAEVLDTTDESIIQTFCRGVQNVAALSRAVGIPTEASAVHLIVEAFKTCAALCIESGDFNFPQMETLRKFVEDPSAFAAAAPAASTAAAAPAKAAAPEPESEDEEEEDMGFSLFD